MYKNLNFVSWQLNEGMIHNKMKKNNINCGINICTSRYQRPDSIHIQTLNSVIKRGVLFQISGTLFGKNIHSLVN